MANLRETSTWEAGIYQWETSDPVMGGENGIDNRPTRQLANRTLWLKNEIARAIALIGTNQQTATQQFALKTTSLTAGAGLSGGGVLRDNMTLSLGTPSKITATSQNSAVSNTHTHEIDKANTTTAGIVKLNNTLTSDAQDEALTAAQGKVLSEQIASAVAGGFALRGSLGSRNLNDVIGSENYGVWDNSTNVNATSEKNYPTTKAGTLLVLPSAYKGQQVYIPFDEPSIWMRDTRSNATQTVWGQWFKYGSDKLGNAGNQTLSGSLNITNNGWEKINFPTAGGRWRMEFDPQGANNKRMNFNFVGDDRSQSYIWFPTLTQNENVAYQSWAVAKSGDVMTGHLEIREAGGYSSVRLHNNGNRETRLETLPENIKDKVFQLADRRGTGGFTFYAFPESPSSQLVAYQSWVSEQIDNKDFLQTVNFYDKPSATYTNSGFYRGNGKKINDLATPSMEIHITHPSFQNNAYARGIGLGYGGGFNIVTTSWDKDGNYLGYKTVLTEENGVMLSGDQSIAGAKTFTSGSIGVQNGSKNAAFGIGTSDTYVGNLTSRKYLQLRDDGVLSYSNDKVILYSDRSDDHNLDRTDKFATSRAVKRVHDIARQATPSGMIAYCAGSYPPAGWLKANGAAVSRTVYADLFAAIGTHFGAGNGSTTFNLPDLRGEFIRSWDDGRGVDNGRNFGTHQGDAMRNITGRLPLFDDLTINNGTVTDGVFYHTTELGQLPEGNRRESGVRAHLDVSRSVPTAGENRPRNIALLACIKI